MERHVANLNNGKGLQWGMEQPIAKERSLKTIVGLGDAAKKLEKTCKKIKKIDLAWVS